MPGSGQTKRAVVGQPTRQFELDALRILASDRCAAVLSQASKKTRCAPDA